MRAQLAIAFALVTSLTEIQAQDMDAVARPYVIQAVDSARQVLVAEFSKHPERVHHISITFHFQIDARGRPHDVKIVSKTHNAWAVDTARRALAAAKFPPIPKKIVQAGADLANIEGDFSANASQ